MSSKITVREMCIFAMMSALMYVTKVVMQVLPNVHLLALFIASLTIVYRIKALIPLYLYVFIEGLFAGFSLWWYPYLYIWAFLWLGIMLIPRGLKKTKLAVFGSLCCALHGMLFGTLYAPFQAFAFHLNFNGMLAWIVAGLGFDALHAVSNLAFSILIIPFVKLICLFDKKQLPYAEDDQKK